MTLRTTPLQFGYFFSLLMFILFMARGIKQQRTSDKMLGWIMFIMATELQDYTFGFAGINFLWNELNGFPRSFSLLFGPVVYFYFCSQLNHLFKFKTKHLWHFLPYILYVSYSLFFFIQGPEIVIKQQASSTEAVLNYIHILGLWISYGFYLTASLRLYTKYKNWSINQFSNIELINFNWFKNFIYAMLFWIVCREFINIIDSIYNLSFYQDWWWNLALVAVSFYIGITGYSQFQTANLNFIGAELIQTSLPQLKEPQKEVLVDAKQLSIAKRINDLMENEQLFLHPDLNLKEVSQRLNANNSEVSAAINQVFKKNFNDYINSLRIDTFIQLFSNKDNKQFTMLSIAFDSGFNSKATFNRAFKKTKGLSPKAYFEKETANEND